MSGRIGALVLAGGASRRMRGRDKLLEDADGEPLLRRVARRVVATGLPVTVALPAGHAARRRALDGLDLAILEVAEASEGMAATRTRGIEVAGRDMDALMLVLGDLPDLRTEDMATVLAAFDAAGGERPARGAGEDGTPGAPVIVPRRLLAALAALEGDESGRALLAREDPLLVPLPGRRAVTDLDTPEDWAAWRAGRDSD